MKNLRWVVVLLLLVSMKSFAQGPSVSLYPDISGSTVTYKTSKAVIRFSNQDIINRFEVEKNGGWFSVFAEDDLNRYNNAIEWLKAGNNAKLSEEKPAGNYATEFTELIKKWMGAALIKEGKAHVTNLKKKVQSSVTYIISPSPTMIGSQQYDFYFIDDTIPFFTGQIEKVIIEEVKGVEVNDAVIVFEEPAEAVVGPEDENEIFLVVEESPTYPGGMSKLEEYIAKNLKYPKAALAGRIEGRVWVGFVVEKDGVLSDIIVIRGLETSCDTEAIRLIQGCGQWIPGKQRGKVKRVKFVYPVRFKLQEQN